MKLSGKLRSWVLAISFGFISYSVLAAEEDAATLLRPPRGELHPSVWEQYGWLVGSAAILVLIMVALWIAWLRRSKPTPAVSAAALARRDLEVLRGRSEDDSVVTHVSRILRQYIISAFYLPRAELTTAELFKLLPSRPQTSATLTAAIHNFLRQCDERKFSPTPPIPQAGVVDKALELVEHIEAHQRQAPGVEGFIPQAVKLSPSPA
ncbi:MAG: hypothetical protein JWQ71_1305 [Pedosphaera sp.]|nr:hypothetical protein [Pedosphaera sp.]